MIGPSTIFPKVPQPTMSPQAPSVVAVDGVITLAFADRGTTLSFELILADGVTTLSSCRLRKTSQGSSVGSSIASASPPPSFASFTWGPTAAVELRTKKPLILRTTEVFSMELAEGDTWAFRLSLPNGFLKNVKISSIRLYSDLAKNMVNKKLSNSPQRWVGIIQKREIRTTMGYFLGSGGACITLLMTAALHRIT